MYWVKWLICGLCQCSSTLVILMGILWIKVHKVTKVEKHLFELLAINSYILTELSYFTSLFLTFICYHSVG